MTPGPATITLPPLPARDPRGHKGTFGTVCVFGGCCTAQVRMIGAPTLSARAAIRAGAGLARLVMPSPIINEGLARCPFATGAPLPTDDNGEIIAHLAAEEFDRQRDGCRCLVIGPGLGVSDGSRALSLRAVQQDQTPVVVDADALTVLSEVPELSRDFRAAAVLTPHPGEFARLARSFRITRDPVAPADRPRAAEELAQRLGCIVVLKGAGTVVSDGHRTWTTSSGHACLATGGSGDVLSGVIAGLIAQHVRLEAPELAAARARAGAASPASFDLFAAAQVGVEAHARAGERWSKASGRDAGLLPEELADLIPDVLAGMRSKA